MNKKDQISKKAEGKNDYVDIIVHLSNLALAIGAERVAARNVAPEGFVTNG